MKSERIDWAKRLERIEREKAKERQGTRTDICQKSDTSNFSRTDDSVAEQSGFGSRDTFSKAKFIAEHATPELIAELDEGSVSINQKDKSVLF